MTTRQTPDAVREALEQRKAVNIVLGRLLAPLVPDVVERIRIGNDACTAILAALDSRADHDRRIYEQGRRDACEDHDIALDSRAGDAGERMREAIDKGLQAFCGDTPDFTMSSGMRRCAADFILGQPGMWPGAPAPAVDAVPAGEGRYLADRFQWAAPGDQQEDAWIVRFCDNDVRDMLFTGPDAEREAWEAWEKHAPGYNMYVFRLAALSHGEGRK